MLPDAPASSLWTVLKSEKGGYCLTFRYKNSARADNLQNEFLKFWVWIIREINLYGIVKKGTINTRKNKVSIE